VFKSSLEDIRSIGIGALVFTDVFSSRSAKLSVQDIVSGTGILSGQSLS